MVTDKLGQLVKANDQIAIAELKGSNSSSELNGILAFATVLKVEKNYLKIKYNIGNIDNYFVSKEFILFAKHNLYSTLENVTFDLVGL